MSDISFSGSEPKIGANWGVHIFDFRGIIRLRREHGIDVMEVTDCRKRPGIE
jgi:hypothetical protein